MSAEAKLKEMGIELPEIPTAGGNYLHGGISGNHLYLSGKVDRSVIGKVGADVTLDEAYQAARQIGLYQLAVMREELGSLDRVKRVVKVLPRLKAGHRMSRLNWSKVLAVSRWRPLKPQPSCWRTAKTH